jgi:putative RecB family exonuclease
MSEMPGTPVYEAPTSLSPSRVDAFISCPLQFRFASIERLPEPRSPYATKGSLVHRALELLFMRRAIERTSAAAFECLDTAVAEYHRDGEFTALGLSPEAVATFVDDASSLVSGYLKMEDPTTVHDIGLELRLEGSIGALTMRGIIDRLDLTPDGELVVTDYKTGRAPMHNREQGKLGGVNFYAFLCESVLGKRPARVRLMYLRTGETIETVPSAQSVQFLGKRTTAVYSAVERACHTGDFRPKPSALCGSCAFQTWCPAFGGDPSLAAVESLNAAGLLAA